VPGGVVPASGQRQVANRQLRRVRLQPARGGQVHGQERLFAVHVQGRIEATHLQERFAPDRGRAGQEAEHGRARRTLRDPQRGGRHRGRDRVEAGLRPDEHPRAEQADPRVVPQQRGGAGQ
jgi:hypothetical protein